MARPRLELLARHAAVLFVEDNLIVAALRAPNQNATVRDRRYIFARHEKTPSRRAHVDRWRRAHCDRARLFDQVHRDPDVREEQYAMVRASARPRRNPRVPRTSTTWRVIIDL